MSNPSKDNDSWQYRADGTPLEPDEIEMIKRFAAKLNYNYPGSDAINKLIMRELGLDMSDSLISQYAVPLTNLLNNTDNDIGRFNFAKNKTALKPMPANEGPRKPPGYHQLHKDINVKPYCSCGICGSGVDCMAAACPNCSADSTSFVQGDPKTQRDKKNPHAPQQMKNVPLTAALLENKERDDKGILDKKLEPWTVDVGGPTTVEKDFSDPEVEENSDKNHIESVEQTWKELSGED